MNEPTSKGRPAESEGRSLNGNPFAIDCQGGVVIVTPSPEIEKVLEKKLEDTAQLVLAPLRANPLCGLVFDLSKVEYVGSMFLSFLLRCHKRVKEMGSKVVIARATIRTRDLLHMTALDALWPVYDTREEAIRALEAG